MDRAFIPLGGGLRLKVLGPGAAQLLWISVPFLDLSGSASGVLTTPFRECCQNLLVAFLVQAIHRHKEHT